MWAVTTQGDLPDDYESRDHPESVPAWDDYEMYVDPTRPVNSARFVFLDPQGDQLLPRLGTRRH